MHPNTKTTVVRTRKKIITPLHCPIPECIYSVGSDRFFSNKKLLDQHIAKVHAEKKFLCTKCQKSFGKDWWRKHHEETCGIEWKCPCGLKYTSKESLLTHARRNCHVLPGDIYTCKMKQSKHPPQQRANTVVVLLQPIIQNSISLQPIQKPSPGLRRIISKAMKPSYNLYVDLGKTVSNTHSSPNTIRAVCSMETNTNKETPSSQYLMKTEATPSKPLLISSFTQTSEDLNVFKKRESRASQCYRRKSKLTSVLESTETQTSESAVVKIKRKRPRRKSVAITTEQTGWEDHLPLWPNFRDLVIPCTDSPFRNTASTQTCSNKILCDSQTITDEEFLKFVFDEGAKDKSSSSEFNLIPSMSSDETLPDLRSNSLSSMAMFPQKNTTPCHSETAPNASKDYINQAANTVQTSHLVKALSVVREENLLTNPISDLYPELNSTASSNSTNKTTASTQSDIYTQTMLDYTNLLANMETQTTGDFSMYDLEFLDTETQTPWEDFLNIDESLLETNHLSIEIQTDFSPLSSEVDSSSYSFGMNENMSMQCEVLYKEGVHTETQTQDMFLFPELTHTESQTLDVGDMFQN